MLEVLRSLTFPSNCSYSSSEALRHCVRASRSMRQLHVSANKDYQPPKQGQAHQKVPKSTDSLKSSRNVHTHPSKDREKARRLEQDRCASCAPVQVLLAERVFATFPSCRKARRWGASSASVSSSGDWADQYFDEKWVHKQGRLSDWRPAPATLQQAARSARWEENHLRTCNQWRPAGSHSRVFTELLERAGKRKGFWSTGHKTTSLLSQTSLRSQKVRAERAQSHRQLLRSRTVPRCSLGLHWVECCQQAASNRLWCEGCRKEKIEVLRNLPPWAGIVRSF